MVDEDGFLLAFNRAMEEAATHSLRQNAGVRARADAVLGPELLAQMVRYERPAEGGGKVYLYVGEGGSSVEEFWLWDLVQRAVGEFLIGLILIDFRGVIHAMNGVAEDMLGITRGTATGRAVCELVPELGVVLNALKHRRGMESLRNRVFDYEVDGQIKHILFDAYPLKEGGSLYHRKILLFLKDIGERPDRQMQRQEKLATVGKIAAGIAHEIRNPLTSIKGFLQIMLQNFERLHMHKEIQYTEVMLAEIDRVNELVSELLLLSKPKDIKLVPVEVEELVTGLAPLISSEAILHGIEFHLCVRPTPPVLADAELLKQVFLNLVKNAIEAMENGGKLTICTGVVEEDNLVQIDVQDTGPGIPSYAMDRIFDAFFTTKENGTGLGLPICQRIVNDLGGVIRVSSKGYGTTFTVLLPAWRSGEGDWSPTAGV